MEKEEAIKSFLKELKTALNTCTLYTQDHPYFAKTAVVLKEHIHALFDFLDPIEVSITSSAVLVGADTYEKEAVYQEIVRFLHNRKIKRLRIKKGITTEEITAFMAAVALRPQEIFRSGGILQVLKKNNLSHISIDELEYSQFLKDGSVQVDEVWPFLLNEVIEGGDPNKMNELAADFSGIAGKLKLEDFLRNKQLQENIIKFLRYLKEHNQDNFNKCAEGITKSFIRDKDFSQYDNIDKIKGFLQVLSSDQLANALLDQLSGETEFDSLNLKLFSRLTDEKGHEEVAGVLKERLEKDRYFQENPHISKRLHDLFCLSEDSYISEIYRNTLSTFLKKPDLAGRFHFDRKYLKVNYRFMLLNIFAAEQDYAKLSILIERLLAVWDETVEDNDWEYFSGLIRVLKKKKEEKPSMENFLLEIDRKAAGFIEEIIWIDKPPPELNSFIEYLAASSKDKEYYLENIFSQGRVNAYALKAFFKFFPQARQIFFRNLARRRFDLEFMEKFVEALKLIEADMALEVYKYIYLRSGLMLKTDILKAMAGLAARDENFLLAVIKKETVSLRKEALLILCRDEVAKERALAAMFVSVAGWPWQRQRVISENIKLIEELDMREAVTYLVNLSREKALGSWLIKRKINELLGKWNVRLN